MRAPNLLRLVHIPVQKQVDRGALAIEEDVSKYPELYKELAGRVEPQFLHEFVCVTWLQDDKWHGQPNGFYHRARFEADPVKCGRSVMVVNSKMYN